MTSSQHSEPRATCSCNCRAELTGKGRYLPGHDAKHVSNLARIFRQLEGSDEQQAKVLHEASKLLTGPLFSKFLSQVRK